MLLFCRNDIVNLLAARYGLVDGVVRSMELSGQVDYYISTASHKVTALLVKECEALPTYEIILDVGIPVRILY